MSKKVGRQIYDHVFCLPYQHHHQEQPPCISLRRTYGFFLIPLWCISRWVGFESDWRSQAYLFSQRVAFLIPLFPYLCLLDPPTSMYRISRRYHSNAHWKWSVVVFTLSARDKKDSLSTSYYKLEKVSILILCMESKCELCQVNGIWNIHAVTHSFNWSNIFAWEWNEFLSVRMKENRK